MLVARRPSKWLLSTSHPPHPQWSSNMTRRLLLSCALALLAGAWAAPARADQIVWSYSVTPDSAVVKSTSGLRPVRVSGEPLGSGTGDSDVVLASLSTISKSAAADAMGNASYSLG